MITELSERNFGEFLSSNEIAVVDFYSNWCPPCRIMDPVFKG
ncbi:MAG: thioredoxin family protein [Theionarchaea archaeon]|nr:thioredoxin family protein [Theionarchaea archaeon]